MNHIRHNSPSPIQCLRAFHILFFAYLLFHCYYYNHYKTQKYYFCYCYFCYRYHYYHTTLLLNTLLQILSYPGVVELTTQLLIPANILWLPLCRIYKFGNTLDDLKGISPTLCHHKINMEPDAKPIVDHQRHLNPKMKEVVRTEILKLLEAGIIYPKLIVDG